MQDDCLWVVLLGAQHCVGKCGVCVVSGQRQGGLNSSSPHSNTVKVSFLSLSSSVQ